MVKEPTTTKIKLEAKPLNIKQRWNVFVTLLPWALIFAFAILFAGMNIGHSEAVNSYNHDQSIKDAAVKSVSKTNQ